MNTPFPPPAPPAPKKRALWPWLLGGCLTLILLAVVALGALGWFGLKAFGSAMNDVVAQVPGVDEHFGALADVSMDWQATTASNGTAMVLDITGEKGTGELRLELEPATGAFRAASITLPNGETLAMSAEQLEQLQQLQNVLPQG